MSYAEKAQSSKGKEKDKKKWLPSFKLSLPSKTSINVPFSTPSFLKHRSVAPEHRYESYERNSIKPLSIISEEQNEDKLTTITKKLKWYLENSCETPFIWKPKEAAKYANVSIARLEEKDREIKDDRKFKWRNFILQLVISYEHHLKKELAQAHEKVLYLEESLLKLTNCHEWLFLGIKDVLWHVVRASKAFLLLEMDKIKEADMVAREICPAHILRRKPACKAGLHGIKAAVFMEYGHDGNLIALDEAKKAIHFDKTCAEWSFLKGKCMGRIRRLAFCHENVTKEEVGAFNMAVKRDKPGKHEKKNPEYIVYLGQVLREQALREYKTSYPDVNTEEYKKIMIKLGAAYYKYREAMSLRPNCPHMLTRVAYGIMKLPDKYVDLKLIRETIDKAIKLAPENAMAHHVKGQYYERFGVEADVALSAYAKAAELGNFGAAMDLVRMRYRLDKHNFNVIQALKETLEVYKDPLNQEVVYAQCGSYCLFIEKDLIKSIKFYSKAGGNNMDSYAMKSHKPMFIRMKDPVNMFDVLLEELEHNTNLKNFDKESFKILTKFRISLMTYKPTTEKKNRLSVARILEMSRERMDKDARFREIRAEKRKKPFKWNQKKKKKSSDVHSSLPDATQKERRNSNSSVDSDYQRDSIVHGLREFSLGDTQSKKNENNKNDILKDPFERGDSSMSSKFSIARYRYGKDGRLSSRCSSVSSVCSFDDDEDSPIANSFQKSTISQTNDDSTVPTKGIKDLTIHSSKDVFSRDINIGTRRMSLMSISSEDCNVLSSENLSVQDRVKQTYRTSLSYKQNTSQETNLNRSDSSQSLNKGQSKHKRSTKNSNLHRSGSTQSLNLQQNNPTTRKFLGGGYKSAFSSKDSVEDLTRSMTFLPSFVRNEPESKAD